VLQGEPHYASNCPVIKLQLLAILRYLKSAISDVYVALIYVATKTVKTPSMGESITEGTLTEWHKRKG
jgi:hypothetical protein